MSESYQKITRTRAMSDSTEPAHKRIKLSDRLEGLQNDVDVIVRDENKGKAQRDAQFSRVLARLNELHEWTKQEEMGVNLQGER
jgi:hypothetical protein